MGSERSKSALNCHGQPKHFPPMISNSSNIWTVRVLFNAVGKHIHWSSAKFFKSFPSKGCCRFRPEDPSKKGPEFTVGLGTPNLIKGFLCGLSIDGEQVVTFAFGGKSDIDRQSVYRFPRL